MRASSHRTLLVSLISLLSSASTFAGRIDTSEANDYDIHIPLAELPLGVDVGPSLEILSFRGAATGDLPWIARRGWLAVGDALVSLEGENISQFSPRDFADALQRVSQSKLRNNAQLQHQNGESGGAGETITLRVRPGKRQGSASRTSSIYSPLSKEEADQETARWHLSYSTGPLSARKINVTLAVFGSEPKDCAALSVVVASPEDGCSPLRNAQEVEGGHVLVRRGGCSFFAKALSVSNSGGVSLVVIDEGAGRLRMEAEDERNVDISVVMVSKLDGDKLKRLATSTSRATGKVLATLVVTTACLPQSTIGSRPSPQNSEISYQGERPSRRLAALGNGAASSAAKAVTAETAFDAAMEPADAGESRSLEVEPEAKMQGLVLTCRERSSGPIRGGDLILSATKEESAGGGERRGGNEGVGLGGAEDAMSVEFLSTFVTGPLSVGHIGVESAVTSPGEESAGDGGVSRHESTVTILPHGFVYHPVQENKEEAPRAVASTLNIGSRTVLLLPPDPSCSVKQQIQLGARLGAGTLVVIAAASEDASIVSVTTSATESILASFAPDGGKSSYSQAPAKTHARNGQGQERKNFPQEWREDRLQGGRQGEAGGDMQQQQRRQAAGGEDDSYSGRQAHACPPLTVVVGNEEGSQLLEWILAVRDGSGIESGGRRISAEGDGVVVTARLAERDDVGRLWGDVVWAEEPTNWPRGHQQRHRILNRLRKTHSPEHANRYGNEASRTASATRWSLLERAYAAAADEGKRVSVKSSLGSGAAVAGEEDGGRGTTSGTMSAEL